MATNPYEPPKENRPSTPRDVWAARGILGIVGVAIAGASGYLLWQMGNAFSMLVWLFR